LLGEARSAAHSAVALASDLPEAHVAMATMHQYITFDWAAAEEAYETALALNPQNPAPYHRYADFLWTTMRTARSKEIAALALDADPLDGSSLHAVGITYLMAGEFSKSADALGEWNRFHPQSRWSYVKHALALALSGECDEAGKQIDRVRALMDRSPSLLMDSWIAWAHKRCGHDERYASIKSRFEAASANVGNSTDPAFLYYYLLEKDYQNVLRLVETVIETRAPVAMFLQIILPEYLGWQDGWPASAVDDLRVQLDRLDFPPNDINVR